jgi:hypothetical protein
MTYDVFVIIIIILIGSWVFYRDKTSYHRAPHTIWTYCEDPDRIPKTITMCMEGWKKWNPTYKIIMLTKKNYKGYVTIPEEFLAHSNVTDCPERFSDVLRLWVLTEHGGIWLDPSVLLKGSVEEWLFPRYAEYSGFYMEQQSRPTPMIETWCMACNKGSPFMKKWRDEFSQIGQFVNIEAYLLSRKDMGVSFYTLNNPNGRAIQVALQKILQIDKFPLESLYLQKSEEGPYRYLVDATWNSEKAVEAACRIKKYQSPIMNLRKEEREVLEKHLDFDFTLESCGWLD